MSTSASRCGSNASSASRRARRDATSASSAPGTFIRFHPLEQSDGLRGTPAGTREQIDGHLARRRNDQPVDDSGALVYEVVLGSREEHVRGAVDRPEPEFVSCAIRIVYVDHGEPRRRIASEVLRSNG